jgi:hypothetical protein
MRMRFRILIEAAGQNATLPSALVRPGAAGCFPTLILGIGARCTARTCPDDENAKFNYAGHWLYVLRTAYVEFRKVARRNGFRGSFKATCQACLPPNVTTPEAWVNAAEDVTVEYEARTALEEGRASGNGLEQRWAEDARDEQEQRFHDRG